MCGTTPLLCAMNMFGKLSTVCSSQALLRTEGCQLPPGCCYSYGSHHVRSISPCVNVDMLGDICISFVYLCIFIFHEMSHLALRVCMLIDEWLGQFEISKRTLCHCSFTPFCQSPRCGICSSFHRGAFWCRVSIRATPNRMKPFGLLPIECTCDTGAAGLRTCLQAMTTTCCFHDIHNRSRWSRITKLLPMNLVESSRLMELLPLCDTNYRD